MEIALIVAIAQNGVIGFDGAMPWRLSADMKRFKAITMGKPVVMGRKTYESIGRSLPGRLNVIVSRSGFEAQGVSTVGSVEAALELSRDWARANDADEICIIGGGEIYRQSIGLADKLYVTHVLTQPDGDTLFPAIEEARWRVISSERTGKSENDSAETIFVVYERNSDASMRSGH
ncbi:MAG: dihydrofolate reductase [Rhizobiaceae bacterium]|nr:dihydrofolate reductase [Rhizobiaceae bacterium]